MKDFWNSRYAAKDYAYGEEPNQFFKQELLNLKAKSILLPAEGEGRNAVFAAENGWEVTAFDFSNSGKLKALELAKKRNTIINYVIADFQNFTAPPESFDCLAFTFVHIPPLKRSIYHKKMLEFLKPGGTLILEGFSKEQIHRDSGGPKKIEMLFSEDELRDDFDALIIRTMESIETELREGEFHKGTAAVIRLVAKKPG